MNEQIIVDVPTTIMYAISMSVVEGPKHSYSYIIFIVLFSVDILNDGVYQRVLVRLLLIMQFLIYKVLIFL